MWTSCCSDLSRSYSGNKDAKWLQVWRLDMCGRYGLSRRKLIIEEHFDTADWQDDWSPRYNIAPTQPVPVIRQNSKEPVRVLSVMKWGLIPSWAKDSSVAASMINARSETASTRARARKNYWRLLRKYPEVDARLGLNEGSAY
jgi:hypothetical protein